MAFSNKKYRLHLKKCTDTLKIMSPTSFYLNLLLSACIILSCSASHLLPFKNKLKINAKTANPVAIQNASLMPSIYASDLRILR